MARKSRLSEEMNVITPNKNIVCFSCKHREDGVIGYKNKYCRIFTKEKGGKNIEILYDGADCPKKEIER